MSPPWTLSNPNRYVPSHRIPWRSPRVRNYVCFTESSVIGNFPLVRYSSKEDLNSHWNVTVFTWVSLHPLPPKCSLEMCKNKPPIISMRIFSLFTTSFAYNWNNNCYLDPLRVSLLAWKYKRRSTDWQLRKFLFLMEFIKFELSRRRIFKVSV